MIRVLIFGATGMLGQGVLRECLRDDIVTQVVTVGRVASGHAASKLREILLADLSPAAMSSVDLRGFDACFFCIGVSAFGMSEDAYVRVTHDLTLAIATPLARDNPGMVFIYVSGAGTNISGRAMWARVKGQTEATLRRLPFRAVFIFRPGFVRPIGAVASKTRLYRLIYTAAGPVASLIGFVWRDATTTTVALGRAMIAIAHDGDRSSVLNNREINDAASRHGSRAR